MSASSEPAPASLRVLVVEDDGVDRAAIRRALRREQLDIELTEVATLEAAKVAAAERRFDCALVDYRLPDGDALDLLAHLDGAGLDAPPVVILTGVDDDRLALTALQKGAQDYLAKAEMSGRSLARAIRHAIECTRVRELQQRLLQAERLVAIAQLAAGVAHEINSPANSVLGNLELLDGDLRELLDHPEASPELGRQLEACCKAVRAGLTEMQRIRAISKRLRNFTQIDLDEVEAVDLLELLESACRFVAAELRPRARLVKDLEPLPRIAGHRGNLAQILINLLNNAIRAIEPGDPEGNEIRLRARSEGETIRLSIEDTGVGIGAEALERVFQPFFSESSDERGAGLGLPLCLDVARKHGGDIEIRSEPGVGTRVDLILPRDTSLAPGAPEPELEPEPESVPAPSSSPPPRARVLVIDDEPLLRRTYSMLLRRDHEVTLAPGGREALERLQRDPDFDVILCDLMMPEVDGLAVYEYLSAQLPRAAERVVFCTGGVLDLRTERFLARVDNICLHKPVTRDELLEVIADVAAR